MTDRMAWVVHEKGFSETLVMALLVLFVCVEITVSPEASQNVRHKTRKCTRKLRIANQTLTVVNTVALALLDQRRPVHRDAPSHRLPTGNPTPLRQRNSASCASSVPPSFLVLPLALIVATVVVPPVLFLGSLVTRALQRSDAACEDGSYTTAQTVQILKTYKNVAITTPHSKVRSMKGIIYLVP